MKSATESAFHQVKAAANGEALNDIHSALRLIATVGAISIHLRGIGLQSSDLVSTHIGTFLFSSARCSVPIFFIISGYFLLKKIEPLDLYLKKRVTRILPPLVAWVLVYMAWNELMRPTGRLFHVEDLAWRVATLDFNFHLWFLFSLLGAYLFVPVLRLVVNTPPHENQNTTYLAWTFFITTGIATTAWAYTNKVTWLSPPTPAPFHDCLQYAGFMLVPFFKIPVLEKMTVTKLTVLFVSLSILSAVGLTLFPTRLKPIMENYSGWVVLAQSLTAYYALTKYLRSSPRLTAFLVKPTYVQACFGIYLVHLIFVDLLFQHTPGVPASILLQLLLTIGVFFVSYAAIQAIGLISPLRIICGLPNRVPLAAVRR